MDQKDKELDEYDLKVFELQGQINSLTTKFEEISGKYENILLTLEKAEQDK